MKTNIVLMGVNDSTQVEFLQRMSAGGFAVEVNGLSADRLALRSSGALATPSATEIGSYLFSVVADPETRNGMMILKSRAQRKRAKRSQRKKAMNGP